jgi:uncharacterized membrane protein (DUF4010 family)
LFVSLGLAGTAAAWLLSREKMQGLPRDAGLKRNPLELTSAALFALLLVAMAVATHFVATSQPGVGLEGLAIAAGLSDIDAFVVSLLQTRTPVPARTVARAIIVATVTNNILKTAYMVVFAQRPAALAATAVLLVLTSIAAGFAVFAL